jgi:uncharacterized protein YndB with AHSA1/START domain
MAELHLEVDVAAPAETVFDMLADVRRYGEWLDESASYRGTAEVRPDGPIAEGSTYVEPERRGVRRGTVTEFERPTRLTFHQPMTLKPKLAGVIDITVRYTLTPREDSVHVDRDVTIGLPWSLKLVQPVVARQFRTESQRTMDELKAYLERPS